MRLQLLRVLAPGIALLALFLSSACGKSEASCETTAQCESGFVCSAEGLCLSFDASLPDASPPCPEATHFCAAPVPESWTGPVVGTQAAIGETLAACTGDYGTEASVVGEVPLGAGACGCSCGGTAANVECGDATIAERNSTGGIECTTCLAAASCQSKSIPPTDVCTGIPGNVGDLAALRVFIGTVSNSGTCADPIVTNNLTTFFGSDERYCSAEALPASCASQGACLPNVSDAEFSAMCIFQSGDHDCPAGYPAKETRQESIFDSRECSECTCAGPPVGQSCGGTVDIGFQTSLGCSGQQVTSTSCINNQVEPDGTTSARYLPAPDTTCNLVGGEQSGEVMGAGQVTFCCTEAIAAPVLN